jgi:hypothetical protein
MVRDQIEFCDPDESLCECCGGTTTKLTRFVTRDGNAFAVYFARFSNNHPDSYVSVLVGFGDWDEQAAPSQRTAIGFRIWTNQENYQVGVIDAEDDWETDYLGRKLTREEALTDPLKQEVFDLSDHIVECDQPIIGYLNQAAGDP